MKRVTNSLGVKDKVPIWTERCQVTKSWIISFFKLCIRYLRLQFGIDINHRYATPFRDSSVSRYIDLSVLTTCIPSHVYIFFPTRNKRKHFQLFRKSQSWQVFLTVITFENEGAEQYRVLTPDCISQHDLRHLFSTSARDFFAQGKVKSGYLKNKRNSFWQ